MGCVAIQDRRVARFDLSWMVQDDHLKMGQSEKVDDYMFEIKPSLHPTNLSFKAANV